MTRDPPSTRSRLHVAAVAEFGEHGYAGARVDRICRMAGVNRERLYANFGSKRELFESVLADRLTTALDATPVRGAGTAAAADFAGDYFDACLGATDLPRLVAWEGLELEQPIDAEQRRERARRKIDELWLATPNLSREQAEDLLLTVVTLCHGWFTNPNLGRVITGDETSHARRRAAITRAAGVLVSE